MAEIDISLIVNHINKTWTNKNCNCCGKNNWNISGKVFELRQYSDGDLLVGSGIPLFPVIPIMCNTCGNTVFINAVATGLISPSKNDTKKGGEDGGK